MTSPELFRGLYEFDQPKPRRSPIKVFAFFILRTCRLPSFNTLFLRPGSEETFFMHNSAEHVILNAHKYRNIKNAALFRLRKTWNAFYPALNVKMPTLCWHFNIHEQEKFHPQLSLA